jgi:hypothetical protein
MRLRIRHFDEADLTTRARISGYFREVIATGDPAAIKLARQVVIRARRRLVARSRLTREK